MSVFGYRVGKSCNYVVVKIIFSPTHNINGDALKANIHLSVKFFLTEKVISKAKLLNMTNIVKMDTHVLSFFCTDEESLEQIDNFAPLTYCASNIIKEFYLTYTDFFQLYNSMYFKSPVSNMQCRSMLIDFMKDYKKFKFNTPDDASILFHEYKKFLKEIETQRDEEFCNSNSIDFYGDE